MEKMSCSDKEEEEEFLPGFRFHPTDEELVGFYLRRKVEKKPLSIELIKQTDIYKYDPWELPKFSSTGDKEWYFFCRRGRKYKNSIRPNRVTGSGFWKATGIDKPIYGVGEKSDDCIGLKKSLVYYRGSAGKGTKTDWMMHEFRLPSTCSKTTTNLHTEKSKQEAEIWTICRIFKRTVTYKKYSQDGSNSSTKRTTPTNTCSNTSSFESDDADTYHFFGTSSAPQQIVERKPLVSHTEGNYHFFSGQLGSIPQSAAFSNLYPTIPNPNVNEFYHRDGNWDELGAIVDQFAIDPALAGGCRYS